MRDFKINAARYQLQLAQKNREISDVALQEQIAVTIRTVKNSYWDYKYALASLDVARQSLDLARESLRDTRSRVEIGTLAPIDIVEAESEVAAREEAVTWRYSLETPSDDWAQADFDDGGWKQGRGGFGAEGTPGAVIGTEWKSGDIWLRREFELATLPHEPVLLLHHDEDAEVFVNGVPAAKVNGYTTTYWRLPISAEGRAALRKGPNVLAIRCKQTAGGQYIDAGIAEREAK